MSESTMNPRYLAIGAVIYAIVSALWVVITAVFGSLSNAVVLGTAVTLIILLIAAAFFTLQQSAKSPLPQAGSAELGKWFGIIFAAEGIGIGVGSGVLVGLGHPDWIAPWVAVVVGLHFLPLARLLKLAFDYVLGAAIIVWVVAIVVLLPTSAWPSLIGLGTAVLLWLAGWGRLWVAHQALHPSLS